MNLQINPFEGEREEWGTDSSRIKIILYDDLNREYNTIWKNSWSDEYGVDENGNLQGTPIEIYEGIFNILPRMGELNHSNDTDVINERGQNKISANETGIVTSENFSFESSPTNHSEDTQDPTLFLYPEKPS